jgi:hypothetical protein
VLKKAIRQAMAAVKQRLAPACLPLLHDIKAPILLDNRAAQVTLESAVDLEEAPATCGPPSRARKKLNPVARYRPESLAVVDVDKAADYLIAWANDNNKTGHFAAHEIDDFWRTANIELDLAEISPKCVRAALEERGLKVGAKRLLMPEYAAVRNRTGRDRAVIYRIPKCRPSSGDEPAIAGHRPANATSSRQSTGIRPALNEKSELHGNFRKVADRRR